MKDRRIYPELPDEEQFVPDEETKERALATIPRQHRELVISPVMDLDVARARMLQFQEFVAHYLEPSLDGGQDGGDYGPIPGAGKKKVLLKSGADKLCELYGLYDEYEIEAQEDFVTKLFYYKIKCILKSRRDDSIVGTGVGSCSTYESKYRWRDSQRKCPKCGIEAIIVGKEEYVKPDGTGFYVCFKKKGGCGIGFKKGDQSIEAQTIGRVENPDIMDTVNTVLKMAKKRAKIDAVIGVTRSSGIFTQDLEDVAMPPAKPPVERTTEEIVIEKPRMATEHPEIGGGRSSGPVADTTAARPEAATVNTEAAPNIPIVGADCIGQGQAVNFERAFKDALPKKMQKQATELSHDWLRQQKIFDATGKPSAYGIKKENFYDVREAACEFAKTFHV